MFTGIVEDRGEIVAVDSLPDDAARLTIRGPRVTDGTGHGDSIAVNGVCLTVVSMDGEAFTADVMRETLVRSSLGSLVVGSPVNLERAVTLSTRMGGHLVQGHVDGVGRVVERTPSQHWEVVRISVPASLTRYIVEKGSVSVDGVSLTVAEVSEPVPVDAQSDAEGWFTVSLIPTTLQLTTLGSAPVGTIVNLEVDVVAKYVERLLAVRS